jgi:hypothetical protein
MAAILAVNTLQRLGQHLTRHPDAYQFKAILKSGTKQRRPMLRGAAQQIVGAKLPLLSA